ncbi:MAG: extracellular solute-binding protein [Candidatus Gracilibacteria bacterium]|nr:extracellular solute-binding protein [Candidatus Gracilibacteria bacterium]
MNNRKIIFLVIIGAIILIISIVLLLLTKSDKKNISKSSGNFKIWIVGDSKIKFEEFMSSFKLANKSMSNVEFDVKSFSNYEDYNLALNSAFIKGVSPDIFILNNNEISLFEEKVYALSNIKIDIHKFRQDYNTVFIDDLIVTTGEGEEKKEFLKGIPIGYETLGILYNARFRLKRSDFNQTYSLDSAIRKIKGFDVIPLGMGNGSSVVYAGDLLAQQFLLNSISSIEDSDNIKSKAVLAEYMEYGSEEGDNAYNSLYAKSKVSGKNNIDFFAENQVGAIITYPRVIEQLKTYGFSSRFLYAAPYPHRTTGDGPTLANYNYFVINSDSEQKIIALAFMNYINSDLGSEEYLSKYKYYLPAKRNLEDKLGERKISSYFPNIQLRDFYSDEPLSSFNKGNKVIYDKEIQNVLDNFGSYLDTFDSFKNSILCKTDKILELKNLSISCE